jgi:hypothetical protein
MKQLLATASLMSVILPGLAADPVVPYPEGYRDWHHVKSMVIQQGHPLYEAFGGIHHIYANRQAMAGYKAGKFADGSVIAFDLLEAKAEGNALTEGARKVLGVMHKDGKKYAATGGWGFEGFGAGDKEKRVVRDKAAGACFECHASEKQHDYVFSRLRN